MPASEEWLDLVRQRLAGNQRVRRTLEPWGRLHVDRQLPFLVVYRQPPQREDAGTERLATTSASYLCGSGARSAHAAFSRLARTVVDVQLEAFGGFLLLELWAGPDLPGPKPAFRLHVPRSFADDATVNTLAARLGAVRVRRHRAEVKIVRTARTSPPGLPSLLRGAQVRDRNIQVIGLEVSPVWRDGEDDNAAVEKQYPLVLAALARQVSSALKRCFYDFSCANTEQCPVHYHSLGRRALVKAAWTVDGELAAVGNRFELLLLCTPVNAEKAWDRFRRKDFAEIPKFRYRPLPLDPVLLKRRLYSIPVERIEDPQLERMFRQKQFELDEQITLLQNRETPTFRAHSAGLYGPVDSKLLGLARRILKRHKAPQGKSARTGGVLKPQEFARMARKELRAYKRVHSAVSTKVEVRDDLPSGLMVSSGRLLMGAGSRIPKGRADALLQHEVGTHVVTWYNGRAQPLQLLASGLAGYEELQEGAAVLAEYLVGGLNAARLRLLAARVLAARSVLEGQDFIETFRLLHETHGFEPRPAFNATMRVHRAGGLTKDIIYLRGLQAVLEYIAGGGDFEILLTGKVALEHVGLVEELLHRKVLRPPPLRPRFLDRPEAIDRLARLRSGASIEDLVK